MADDKKRLKSEVERDRAGIEFRKQRMSGLVNPCPICHTPMVWLSSPQYEGWECEQCNRKVAMGNPVDKEAESAKDQEAKIIERKTIIRRFGDRRPGGCSSC